MRLSAQRVESLLSQRSMGRWPNPGMKQNPQRNWRRGEYWGDDLVISNAYLCYRVAMKKSGPTIDSFLKKMQQQMGVAIVGCAAYRDNEGKLCTFEYVIPLSSRAHPTYQSWLLYSFCTKDERKDTFIQAHSKDIEEFLGKWGKWVAQKGNVADSYPPPTYLPGYLGLGVGGTKPNQRDGEDEQSEEQEDDAWVKLLDGVHGLFSLKTWEEVTASKANKVNIALALRAVMRQSWGGYTSLCYYFLYLTSAVRKIRQEGKSCLGKNQVRSKDLDWLWVPPGNQAWQPYKNVIERYHGLLEALGL